jgi:hypothetical protein
MRWCTRRRVSRSAKQRKCAVPTRQDLTQCVDAPRARARQLGDIRLAVTHPLGGLRLGLAVVCLARLTPLALVRGLEAYPDVTEEQSAWLEVEAAHEAALCRQEELIALATSERAPCRRRERRDVD